MNFPENDESLELRRIAALGWSVDDFIRTKEGVWLAGEEITVNYPDSGFEALGFDGGAGYWFDYRADAVIDVLATTTDAKVVWDIGAGTGAMSLRLARAGFEVVAVEPLSEGALAIAAQGCCPVFRGSLEALRLPPQSLRVLGLFDVIEHLADPARLMLEVNRVLDPSGVVVITVPAFQLLWSNADVVSGHQRRYTTDSLDRFMTSHGFARVTSRYIFASLLLPTAILRSLPYRFGRRLSEEQEMAAASRALMPSRKVDAALRALLHVETAMSKHIRLPAGLTVLAVYRANSSRPA